MRRIFIFLIGIISISLSSFAQKGLNVEPYFSDSFVETSGVTLVSLNYRPEENSGMRKYRSISVVDQPQLADRIKGAVMKDGASSKSKEVSFKDGELYFGFYAMGGRGASRRYLLFLNRRPKGVEKTTLIYIEGDLDELAVKSIINKKR